MLMLKKFLPRSLYGRAALILIVPVVAIQFVVSLAFIQRHYEGVTRQMTSGVALEINLLVERYFQTGTRTAALSAALADAGALELRLSAAPLRANHTDTVAWLDFSGQAIVETLHAHVEGLTEVDALRNDRIVTARLETPTGAILAHIARSRMSATNPHQLLVLMMLTALLMTLVSFVFLRNQLRPITRLGEVAEAFGRGERLNYRPRGAQEVRAAGRAFLEMRDRIERQIEQRMLMLSGVSHDLRTPLTRMRLQLSLMEEDEDTRALLGDVAQMQRMVDEFLAFVRGDATDVEAPTDLVALVRGVVEDANRAGHNMAAPRIYGQPREVLMRGAAVARALENLITNALRHAQEVVVILAFRRSHIYILVEDDGPGIPENLREKALQPFARLTSERNPNAGGGVGLGLAIAADVAASHGGKLSLGQSLGLGGLRAEFLMKR